MSPRVSAAYRERKKRELLLAAKEVFLDKGFHAATMQDIMQAADISRGALYNYFDNIEHVYLELLHAEDERDAAYFGQNRPGTVWERLMEWIEGQKTALQTERSLVRANSEFFLSEQVRQKQDFYLTERYERLVQLLADFLDQGAEQGGLQLQVSAQDMARFIISFMDGLWINTAHLGVQRVAGVQQLDLLTITLQRLLQPVQL